MRSHGVTDFPDPMAEGGFDLQGLNLKNNPDWSTATEVCQSDLPGGGPAGKAAENAVSAQEGLKLASCMRSHGVTSFPDPDSSGQFVINPSSGIDPNSPQFETAEKACEPSGSHGIPIGMVGGSDGS
ncbi:MAG TPA: hypothetical protein VMD59_17920 [Acidimicrobiales bacterium]|nr:hypothetical protein [Acidimicrobiales bacterium]